MIDRLIDHYHPRSSCSKSHLRKHCSEIFNGDNEYFFFLPEIDLGQRSIQVERVRRCAIPPFEE